MPEKLRARIRLNLGREAANAENSIHIQNPETGAWPTAAYAQNIILENVTPVYWDSKIDAIASGDSHKQVCSFLEGDLVKWTGRYADNCSDSCIDALKASDSHYTDNSALDDDILSAHAANIRVEFNPKRCKRFYIGPLDSDEAKQFDSARRMAVYQNRCWANEARCSDLEAEHIIPKDERQQVSDDEKRKLGHFTRAALAREAELGIIR